MRYCNSPSKTDPNVPCGKPIERSKYGNGRMEPLNKFEARECCSRQCTVRKAYLKRVIKKEWNNVCEVCNKPIERITYSSGRQEPWNNYMRKRSHAQCRGKLAKMTKEKKIANDVISIFRECMDMPWAWLTALDVPSYRPENRPENKSRFT